MFLVCIRGPTWFIRWGFATALSDIVRNLETHGSNRSPSLIPFKGIKLYKSYQKGIKIPRSLPSGS